MKKLSLLFILILSIVSFMEAQNSPPGFRLIELGVESKAYPAGSIHGIRSEFSIGDRNSISLLAAYNVLYHGSLGVHENEKGGGPGAALGYRYYFKDYHKGLFLGASIDSYFNRVQWKDNIDLVNEISGTSDIIVFQPLAEAGWMFLWAQDQLTFGPFFSFGYEVNVKTVGAETGQGPIAILGLTIGWSAKRSSFNFGGR